MADKEISMLPGSGGVTDDTIIPVYQPGALEPAQSMTGAQFRAFGEKAGESVMAEIGDRYSEIFDGKVSAAETAAAVATEQADLAKQYAENAKTPIGENSVTPNMTTFFKETVTYYNLYDATKTTAGKKIDTTGKIADSPNGYLSDYIAVESGKSYYVGKANGTNGATLLTSSLWAIYDSDKNVVAPSSSKITDILASIPDGVAYVRFTNGYDNGASNIMFVEGSAAPTAFVNHEDSKVVEVGWKDAELKEAVNEDACEFVFSEFDKRQFDGSNIIKDHSIPIAKNDSVIEYNLNLVNPAEVEIGKGISSTTGELIDYSFTAATGYIPVVAGRKYYVSLIINGVYFYDKEKRFSQQISWSSAENLLAGFEVPSDGFVRMVCGTGKTLALNDYGMNVIPAEYGTKKIVYSDENGTIFPQAVEDSGVVPSFAWKKVNLAEKDRYIFGSHSNGVYSVIAETGAKGFIVDVIPGTEYVFKSANSNTKTIIQYREDWSFVSNEKVDMASDLSEPSFRYTAPDGVSHIIVDCMGFFAKASDVTPEILENIHTNDDGLAIKYNPTGMAEHVRQFAAKTILRDQSALLQQTIHKSSGLKWNCLGDSLTALRWGSNMYNIVADALGLTAKNYGIVSSTIADYAGDGTYGDPMCLRYSEMDDDADIVTVMGGTNDDSRDDRVGTMADRNGTTLYGACHVLFSGLIEKYPNARIAVILPPQNGQGIPSYVETQGGDANMNGMRKKVGIIREVAEYYSLPVCDLFNHGGIPGMIPSTINRLLQGDYLHITTEGYKVLSRQLLPFMRNLIG